MLILDRTTLFLNSGSPLGFGAVDFWEWFAAYGLDGSVRGALAEFLVMKSLGADQIRNIWEPYDLEYMGYRIEVKSASLFTGKHKNFFEYHYSENKRISYSIEPKHLHISGGDWTSSARHSDCYIFSLVTSTDVSRLDDWIFFVIPTQILNSMYLSARSISLPAVKKIGIESTYDNLPIVFDKAMNGGNKMNDIKKCALEDLIHVTSDPQNPRVQELQRLVMCYQLASRDDQNVVWAALNKYASQIDKI